MVDPAKSTRSPRPASVQSKPSATDSPEASDLPSLSGPVPRVRLPFFYVLAALPVSIIMVLLPLLYLALIGLIAYGTYLHAAHNHTWMYEASGGVSIGRAKLFAYLAPMVVGGLLIVFMIKPIVIRGPREEMPLSLDASQEPKLFAFVGMLCKALGTPSPRRIDISCDLNASASFRRGFLSFFGNDMVLTLGLPLVSGLTRAELAGVIAHEFGHFTQWFALRLTYVISSINHWFARVVYQRDSLDGWLAGESESTEYAAFKLVLMMAQFGVWLGRLILKAFMLIGLLSSAVLLRQMEYHADQYEANLVGSRTYESTARKLELLNAAMASAISDLQHSWKERRLVDNFPLLVALCARRFPADVQAKLDKRLAEQKTGLFDTHPCSRARIARVKKREAEGVLHDDGPATTLFGNYRQIAHAVTLAQYRDEFELEVTADNLVPTEKLFGEHERLAEEFEATRDYYKPGIMSGLPLFLGDEPIIGPADANQSARRLVAARQKLKAAEASIAKWMALRQEGIEKQRAGMTAQIYLRMNLPIDRVQMKLPSVKPQDIESLIKQNNAQVESVQGKLEACLKLQRVRLRSALELLHVPLIRKRLPQADEYIDEAERLMAALRRLEATFPIWNDIWEQWAPMLPFSEAGCTFEEFERSSSKGAGIVSNAGKVLFERLKEFKQAVKEDPYPLPHGGPATLAAYAIPHLPSARNYVAIAQVAPAMHQNIGALYMKIMARLANIALAVEKVLDARLAASTKPNTVAAR